jgi:hypothetical protein
MGDSHIQPTTAEPTPTPWFVSGVRYRMNGGEWHNINRYDETTKRDENVACVGYDPRTGLGLADAHFIVECVNSHATLKACIEDQSAALILACNEIADRTTRIQELESNEAAYEAILGQRTYNEVAAHIEELEGALRNVMQRANEGTGDQMGMNETIWAMHRMASAALQPETGS